jgi:hypothetical protein
VHDGGDRVDGRVVEEHLVAVRDETLAERIALAWLDPMMTRCGAWEPRATSACKRGIEPRERSTSTPGPGHALGRRKGDRR